MNVRLIDAETGAHLWAEQVDRDFRELFAIQQEITARLGNTLKVQLVNAEGSRRPTDPKALDYLFRGRATRNKGSTPSNYAAAIEFYEQALAIDSSSIDARIFLASSLIGRVLDELAKDPAADIARADDLLAQAAQNARPSEQAHFARGQLLRAGDRCAEAITEYEMALAANPNRAMTLSHIGRCKTRLGLVSEAIPFQEQAMRLSPADPDAFVFYFRIGEAHLLESRTEEAVRWLEQARSANPTSPFIHAWLASAYATRGDAERAATELATARRLKGQDSYASIARISAGAQWRSPTVRALYERTYFAGLRMAGVPEE